MNLKLVSLKHMVMEQLRTLKEVHVLTLMLKLKKKIYNFFFFLVVLFYLVFYFQK